MTNKTSEQDRPMRSSNTTIRKRKPKKTWTDQLIFGGFISGLTFLAFMLGVILSVFNWTPYRWSKDSWQAFKALYSQREMFAIKYPKYLWQPVRHQETGVTHYDAAQSQPGLTLYATAEKAAAILLDANGNEVHRWQAPFSRVWPNPSFEKGMIPESRIHIRRAHALKNGDLLAVYSTTQGTPNGIGFAKLDKDSNVIWKYDGNCHHDFDLDAEGNIYTLVHDLRKSVHDDSKYKKRVNIEDFLVVLSPDGNEIKKFSLLNSLYDSPYYRKEVLKRDQYGDLLHTNTVNLVTPEFAAHHPEIQAGQVMVCFRNYNLVAVVDPETEQLVWATNGPWFFPHDPDPLDNGNILIFDNCCSRGTESVSRVIEYNPVDQTIEWEFAGDQSSRLLSDIRSTQQLLANGNVLICESDGGRILEVTPGGEVVWQFVSSVRGGMNNDLLPVMVAVHRYGFDELPFLDVTRGKNDSRIAASEQ